MDDSENIKETRQERRERKLTSKRDHQKKHNQNMAHLYKEAIIKRITKLRENKGKRQEAGQ